MLKLLSIVKQEVIAVEESQDQSMSTLSPQVFLTHHASNTWLTISTPREDVNQSIFAEIAHGHHVQLEKLASINAGQLSTRNTMFPITIVSVAPLK